MISPHRIPDDEFAALASGGGGAAAIRTLARGQLSKHLLLIKFVVEAWPGSATDRDAALAVLAAAQSRAPDVVGGLLGDPRVGAWVAYVTRRVRASVRHPAPLHSDLGHLGAIAAAAAVSTGLDAEVVAYARDGCVAVPTLGAVRVPLPDGTSVAVRVHGDRLDVTGGPVRISSGRNGEAWQEIHRLVAGANGCAVDVGLDDLDPYRGGHHSPPAPRLPADEVRRWQDSFTLAWGLLTRYAPELAAEIATGLRCMIPLTGAGPQTTLSATVRDAFGAFGLTMPTSAAEMAVTMVHEFQHSKLSAVLDLISLYEPGEETYFAPWRTDARPIGGLFQGVYAFLGVAQAWRRLRADPRLRPDAERLFAHVREQVDEALTILMTSGRLTAAGQRFTTGMRRSVDEMLSEPVPAPVVRSARAALARNRGAWRQRHSWVG
jgi:HEXXH motif-containing protein